MISSSHRPPWKRQPVAEACPSARLLRNAGALAVAVKPFRNSALPKGLSAAQWLQQVIHSRPTIRADLSNEMCTNENATNFSV